MVVLIKYRISIAALFGFAETTLSIDEIVQVFIKSGKAPTRLM